VHEVYREETYDKRCVSERENGKPGGQTLHKIQGKGNWKQPNMNEKLVRNVNDVRTAVLKSRRG